MFWFGLFGGRGFWFARFAFFGGLFAGCMGLPFSACRLISRLLIWCGCGALCCSGRVVLLVWWMDWLLCV